MYKITLTDTRLRSKYLGVSRVMILAGERDVATEPYNGFANISIFVVPASTTEFMPFFRSLKAVQAQASKVVAHVLLVLKYR